MRVFTYLYLRDSARTEEGVERGGEGNYRQGIQRQLRGREDKKSGVIGTEMLGTLSGCNDDATPDGIRKLPAQQTASRIKSKYASTPFPFDTDASPSYIENAHTRAHTHAFLSKANARRSVSRH